MRMATAGALARYAVHTMEGTHGVPYTIWMWGHARCRRHTASRNKVDRQQGYVVVKLTSGGMFQGGALERFEDFRRGA